MTGLHDLSEGEEGEGEGEWAWLRERNSVPRVRREYEKVFFLRGVPSLFVSRSLGAVVIVEAFSIRI